MLFFQLYKIFIFTFCVFLYIIIYTVIIARAIKKINASEIRDFIYENDYKRIGFYKEESCFSLKRLKKGRLLSRANKLIKNVPDRCNAKDHYESFVRKKSRK